MISAIVAFVFDTLLYNLFAFIVPAYWTCKALLRQFTHSRAMPLKSSNDFDGDAARVPDLAMNSISTNDEPLPKFTTLSPAHSLASSDKNPDAPAILTNWLYYWALLGFIHVGLGLYERIALPLMGSSLMYRFVKLSLIAYLGASSSDARPAQLAWSALLGPLVSKYEKDCDAAITAANRITRQGWSQGLAAASNFVARHKLKTA